MFGHIARILYGIVEVDFVQAVKFLVLLELVKVQRERGLVIKAAETAGRAFEMDADIVYTFCSCSPPARWHGRTPGFCLSN